MVIRKFFFAYHSFHSMVFPVMWAEDKGICVGGRPHNILDGHKYEITEEEFNGTMAALEKKYPISLPSLYYPPNWLD